MDTSMSANNTPKSGWSTPSWRCTAGEVSPILRPTMTARSDATRYQLLLDRVGGFDVGVADQAADGCPGVALYWRPT